MSSAAISAGAPIPVMFTTKKPILGYREEDKLDRSDPGELAIGAKRRRHGPGRSAIS